MVRECIAVPRASMSAIDVLIELHADLRDLFRQHKRAGSDPYP
jgi:type IV secretory pathway ATPase VirB11/archaellum biosynthesis ATPase